MSANKMDLSNFRLKDFSELNPFIEKIGYKEFMKYADRVYQRLFGLQPGETFDITKKVEKENQEMFIKIACCYFQEERSNINFNKTFTIITQYPTWQQKKETGHKKKKNTSVKTSDD